MKVMLVFKSNEYTQNPTTNEDSIDSYIYYVEKDTEEELIDYIMKEIFFYSEGVFESHDDGLYRLDFCVSTVNGFIGIFPLDDNNNLNNILKKKIVDLVKIRKEDEDTNVIRRKQKRIIELEKELNELKKDITEEEK